jgi:hypothetical protein
MRCVAAAASRPRLWNCVATHRRAASVPRHAACACSSTSSPHGSAWRLWAPTRRATAVLAQLLADVSLPGDVLCLHGGVGTGKSYFWCATRYDSQRIALRGRVHWPGPRPRCHYTCTADVESRPCISPQPRVCSCSHRRPVLGGAVTNVPAAPGIRVAEQHVRLPMLSSIVGNPAKLTRGACFSGRCIISICTA